MSDIRHAKMLWFGRWEHLGLATSTMTFEAMKRHIASISYTKRQHLKIKSYMKASSVLSREVTVSKIQITQHSQQTRTSISPRNRPKWDFSKISNIKWRRSCCTRSNTTISRCPRNHSISLNNSNIRHSLFGHSITTAATQDLGSSLITTITVLDLARVVNIMVVNLEDQEALEAMAGQERCTREVIVISTVPIKGQEE